MSLLREALSAAGLPHLIDSFASSAPWAAVGPRRYGLLIASRHPITSVATASVVFWPERILSAGVLTPRGTVRVHTTHIPPGSSNGWTKVDMLEAVLDVVSEPSPNPLILCGDFNMPQAETTLGRIVTSAERLRAGAEPRLRARWRGAGALRWDLAERSVMEGGRQRQLIDAFRHLHGYEREEFSWFLKRGPLRRAVDSITSSAHRTCGITRCEYLHDFRESGLSDHARHSSWTSSCDWTRNAVTRPSAPVLLRDSPPLGLTLGDAATGLTDLQGTSGFPARERTDAVATFA